MYSLFGGLFFLVLGLLILPPSMQLGADAKQAVQTHSDSRPKAKDVHFLIQAGEPFLINGQKTLVSGLDLCPAGAGDSGCIVIRKDSSFVVAIFNDPVTKKKTHEDWLIYWDEKPLLAGTFKMIRPNGDLVRKAGGSNLTLMHQPVL